MTKRIIVSAFIASILIYVVSVCYFHNQEEALKTTFLENIKNNTRAELAVNGFKDTLVSIKGDTTFINIPSSKIARTEFASYRIPSDTSRTNN